MDTPICVVDAITLKDHIHEIKHWVYNGQLRLVLSSSTCEYLEQLYQKSLEQKNASQEPSRAKSLGKPGKKEHPLFDINPRVAKEFLARLNAGKEQIPGPLQRPIWDLEEKHAAVDFQQSHEQYTPWKDVEETEEKVDSPAEERPATWAEALRRKQILANGIVEKNHVPKGPAKPKLVAKAAGSDSSPWKMQRNAPRISAKEVPNALRPLMSCALWRLHESIDRNDANQLFLLTDQAELRGVASKLNITVMTTKDLGSRIANMSSTDDLSKLGDLERIFGNIKLADHNLPEGDAGPCPEKVPAADAPSEISAALQDVKNEPKNNSRSSNDNGRTLKIGINGSKERAEEIPSTGLEQRKNHSADGSADEKTLNDGDELVQSTASPVEDHSYMEPACRTPIAVNGSIKKDNQPQEPGKGLHVSHPRPSHEDKAKLNIDELDNGKSALQKEAHGTLPAQHEALEPTQLYQKLSQNQAIQKPTMLTTPAHNELATNVPATSQAQQELEDSDEEVVVFKPNPKRHSAQKKPAQPAPKVSTKAENSQPKPVARTTFKSAKAINHGHPKTLGGPTVIDPDVFGRGFAVNTNPSLQTSVRNMRARHSPRSSVQGVQLHAHPREAAPRNDQRSNLPRHSPHSSPQPPRARPQQRVTNATITPPHQAPGMPRQTLLTASEERPHHSNNQVHPATQASPRPVLRAIDPSFDRNGNHGLQSPHPNGHSRPTNEPVHTVAQPRTSRPTLFEPELDHTNQQDFEVRSSMLDVQYTLKSGSTRASARGKGKLWIG